jgi:hypothetical protein
MGEVIKKTKMAHIKSILKTEMIARTLKKIFYANIS